MEYLWVADGVQESLIDSSAAAECGYLIDADPTRFVTDYYSYANRKWQLGTGNFADNQYGSCVAAEMAGP
jgi:succinate dehydrogenase/fumarate reductase flavoprotein subunit